MKPSDAAMKTADPELMRAINRFHVMDAVRLHGPISRVEIAERTELSAATVSAITAALLDDGLINPRPMGSLRENNRGRPRVMLELNPGAAHVVGVKLSAHQISVAVTNFRADVLESLTMPVRTARQAPAVIADIVEDGVRRCVADAGLCVAAISGLCVGVPGMVERETGLCRRSPIFAEADVPFADLLRARLGVDARVETDVNLVTLAEHWFGHGRGFDDFIVVTVERNIGLGIMHAGELFRGVRGFSSDFGRVAVGAQGDLDAAASQQAIIQRAAVVLGPEGIGDGLANGRAMDMIRARSRDGDARIRAIFDAAGAALGGAIASLIAILAPPRVVVSGEGVRAGEALTAPLRAQIKLRTPPELRGCVDIIVHEWGDDVWARGAAALVLRELYGAPWNTSGPAPRMNIAQG